MGDVKFSPGKPPVSVHVLLGHLPDDVSGKYKVIESKESHEVSLVVGKHTLTPEHNVARYLTRAHLPNLYESSAKQAIEVDTWLELATSPALSTSVATVSKALASHPFLAGKELSLADVIVWSAIVSSPQLHTLFAADHTITKWVERLAALPPFAHAIKASSLSFAAPSKGGKEGKEKAAKAPAAAKEGKAAPAPKDQGYIDRTGIGFFKWEVSLVISKVSNGTYTPEQIYGLLENPKAAEHGDLALPIPRLSQFLKIQGNPAALAADWAAKIPLDGLIAAAQPAGPFLNFKLKRETFIKQVLGEVFQAKDKFGHNEFGKGKTAVIEFSSPNIAKPFHAGHLRSTIIGNFLANVHDAMGFKTIRINYLGDWGKQYGLLAVGFLKYGSEETLQADPIKHLFDIYVQVNKDAEANPGIHDEARAYFKRMEQGEPEALALWKRFRELSIEKYKDIYARLNIHFDVYSGESMFEEGMREELKVLEEKGLLKESQGAQVVDLQEHGLGVVVVKKTDGTTLYITRDIAAATFRKREYQFDEIFYVVAMQQELHFKQLFKTLSLAGYSWHSSCHHIGFGMVAGMSTRQGNVVFLEDILNEAKRVMHEVMKQNEEKYKQIENPDYVSDVVGLSAVIVQDMSARRVKDYEFSWDRMTSFEGDTGPYLQFAHSRLCSIERKAQIQLTGSEDLSLITEEAGFNLAQVISRYPEAVRQAYATQEPCVIVTFAMQLSHTISLALESLWVMNQEPRIAAARSLLYFAARVVLGNAMRLIGLTPLERM